MVATKKRATKKATKVSKEKDISDSSDGLVPITVYDFYSIEDSPFYTGQISILSNGEILIFCPLCYSSDVSHVKFGSKEDRTPWQQAVEFISRNIFPYEFQIVPSND